MELPEATVFSMMHVLWQQGVTEYTPKIRDVELEQETGEPEASLRNMRRLVKYGLIVDHILACADTQRILFTFRYQGASYYAPGMAVGNHGMAVKALAQFMSEIGIGKPKEVYQFIAGYSSQFRGEVIFPTESIDVERHRRRR